MMLDNCDISLRGILTIIKHRALFENTICVRNIPRPGSQRNLGSDTPLNLTEPGTHLSIFKNLSLEPIGHFTPAVHVALGTAFSFQRNFFPVE